MPKLTITENLSRPRLNEESLAKINMIMIVDIFSSINILKYFNQQKPVISIEKNLYKESKKNSNCRNINCAAFNELVMLKELIRDDRLFEKISMGVINEKNIIIDNGHITNMTFLKMSNKKMYKMYMREFKHRKHNWNYVVFLVKNSRTPKNEFENKLLKDLNYVLNQSQVEFVVFDRNHFRTSTLLKKEIKEKILYYFTNSVSDASVMNR
jgi:hypothetical protein